MHAKPPIACIFTIDYEIFGNGEGQLRDLVFEPTERLIRIFAEHAVPFVCFAEVAEFQRIAQFATDPALPDVEAQLRRLRQSGHEIGLHLHPQWCNATFRNGRWALDSREYSLCTLPEDRIRAIVGEAITYLRRTLMDDAYTPTSFRAGNWLFQPTARVARILVEAGIKIDSSVAKGVLLTFHGLDYRAALRNGNLWRFGDDVNVPRADGPLLEIPIYTKMVPFWKLLTAKRVAIHRGGASGATASGRERFCRLVDRSRWFHPLKFDFCRMTLEEMKRVVDEGLARSGHSKDLVLPLVAIGHSKDLVDFDAVDGILTYLEGKGIRITTLQDVYAESLAACRTSAAGECPPLS